MLIFTACDTGSANALVPVLAGLDAKFRLYAQKDAAYVFRKQGIAHECVDSVRWEDLSALGQKILSATDSVSAVVTGTSWGPSVDKALILAAKNAKIFCVSLVEHWDLYLERFSVVKDGAIVEPGLYLPDRIWVNDTIALRESIEAGIPPERLEVVGQPHLERQASLLLNRFRTLAIERHDIVFVSERVATDFSVGSPLYRGFDEFSVLRQLIAASRTSSSRLLIKMHPQEPPGKFDWIISGVPHVSAVKDADNVELILGADIFIGMFSMLLLEAALVRQDVYSFLPGGTPSIFIGNRIGATIPLANEDDVRSVFAKLQPQNPAGQVALTPFGTRFSGSTKRMVEAVRRLAS